ncbi:hypothetical protein KIN20_022780 [Parelaphostrongylus tenuis]|uniref:Uncharacterized protein n=1 Tax=Parelaphostrongylus tenuis TaxID=148309 RepID=A0AAD5MQP3_PARTN|nr:hypothetical protein KIN20_022780 [Parelaphostrongylus tenuis]
MIDVSKLYSAQEVLEPPKEVIATKMNRTIWRMIQQLAARRSVNFVSGRMSGTQLILQAGIAGAKFSKEPKRYSPEHKSLSIYTVDVSKNGLCTASQFVVVKERIAIKALLSDHEATTMNQLGTNRRLRILHETTKKTGKRCEHTSLTLARVSMMD